MFKKSIEWFSIHEKISFFVIIVLFLVLRIPGLHLSYHQDEYKWPMYASLSEGEAGIVPHPPLSEFIYTKIAPLAGSSNFRMIPFVFGIFDLILLYLCVKHLFGKRVALWTSFLFTFSFYSVLSHLMVDTDGAILPFFFLVMLIGYSRWNIHKKFDGWFFLMVVGAVLGLLVKVSFILGIAALIADFAFETGIFSDMKKVFRYAVSVVGICVGFVGILIISKFIFPYFKLGQAIVYWEHFAVFSGRNWFQIFIQAIKSFLYTSPLLLLPLVFGQKSEFRKTKLFLFFIGFGLIFYLGLFDFSLGALDRYMQFSVLPLSVISAVIFERIFRNNGISVHEYSLVGMMTALVFLSVFLPQSVPPLYPKGAWLHKVFTGSWNFLFPFTGGSGPTGFYISFLFIGIIWIITICVAFYGNYSARYLKVCACIILVLGGLYNAVFIEEYMYGKINGSPYYLIDNALLYISEHKNIQHVIVYNDIGGYAVQQLGIYERRMYAAPQFESTYKEILPSFKGHILFIDIPRVDSNSYYGAYMSSCMPIYTNTDRYITAQILDCSKRK